MLRLTLLPLYQPLSSYLLSSKSITAQWDQAEHVFCALGAFDADAAVEYLAQRLAFSYTTRSISSISRKFERAQIIKRQRQMWA